MAGPPPAQDTSVYCANADGDPFDDDDGHTFEPEIGCLASARITSGGPGGLPTNFYGPNQLVSRAQMASFIARTMDTAERTERNAGVTALPAWDGSNQFSDVSAGSAHVAAINRLASAGVLRGGPSGLPADRFGPDLPVTRAQMTTFINSAQRTLTGAAFEASTDYFTDDAGSAHEGNINGVASAGIAIGDGNVTFNPGQSVTRGQMAAFIVRHLAVLEAAGLIAPVTFSPFADDGSGDTPDEIREAEPGDGPTDGEPAAAGASPVGPYEANGGDEPTGVDQDPCSLVTPAEFAAALGVSDPRQQVLEGGDACGYTAPPDRLRVAVGLVAAEDGARWLPQEVASEPVEVAGRPGRWAAVYPVPESAVLVIELGAHDLVLEVSSLRRQHPDDELRRIAVALAEHAIGRYQP